MTEKKRFVYENHKVKDALTGEVHSSNRVSVNVLNQLTEENKELRLQLNLCADQRNEFHRMVRENVNRVGKLEKENEQLKQQINELQYNKSIGQQEYQKRLFE